MAEPVRHRQTKEAATDMLYLKPPRHISTLPNPEVESHIAESPLYPGGLNRSTQHFILGGKDGVWDGTKIS